MVKRKLYYKTSPTSSRKLPMHTWQLQQAKAHLSEVIRLTVKQGPQILTVRGKEEAVLISKQEYERLIGSKPNLFDFMNQSPLKGLYIDWQRTQSKSSFE